MRRLYTLFALLLSGCYYQPPAVVIADQLLGAYDRRLYLEYRNNAEQRNFEREKAGLAPQPILTFPEWRRGG